jgi:hypothetical protein
MAYGSKSMKSEEDEEEEMKSSLLRSKKEEITEKAAVDSKYVRFWVLVSG